VTFDKILVPVDFSTCSLMVAREAAGLAVKLGSRVVLLHVSDLPAGLPADAHVAPEGADTTAGAFVRTDAERRMAEFVAACEAVGAPVELRTEVGPVVATILSAIDRTGAGMVVMGTHGRTGLARLVLGSVAEGVSHRAHVPVMLIRREARPSCRHASCDWCVEGGRSPAEEQLQAESVG
jgi:nucleotide-binding universal stress UspA family protein